MPRSMPRGVAAAGGWAWAETADPTPRIAVTRNIHTRFLIVVTPPNKRWQIAHDRRRNAHWRGASQCPSRRAVPPYNRAREEVHDAMTAIRTVRYIAAIAIAAGSAAGLTLTAQPAAQRGEGTG